MERARESREVWATRVERWVDSGLTAKEFASEVGVNPRTLSYWKWRLRNEGTPDDSAKRSTPRRTKSKESPLFVQVAGLGAPPAETQPRGLEVVVGTDTVVRVPPGFDESTLGRLLAVLRAQR